MSKNISKAIVDKIVNTVTNKVGSKLNQMTEKKKSKNKTNSKTKRINLSKDEMFSQHANPLTSFQIPSNQFSITANAQKNVTCDTKGAIRVSGRSLSGLVASGNASNNRILLDGGLYYAVYPITPTTLDARASNFSMIYNMYAIRKLRMLYVPSCGTGSSSQVAFGMTQDFGAFNVAYSGGVTQQICLELPYSGITTMWAPLSINYSFTGSEVYNTRSSTVNDTDERIQIGLAAAANVNVAQSYGALVFEWVIDYYEPCSYDNAIELSNPDLSLTGTRALRASGWRSDSDDGPDEPKTSSVPGLQIPKLTKSVQRSPSLH